MFDFSGIWYHVIILLLFIILGTINIFEIIKKRKKTNNKDSKSLIEYLICMLACVLLLFHYLSILINPTIKVFVGEMSYESGRRGLDRCYHFSSAIGETKALYLNPITKNRIIPSGFDSEIDYVIYYEEITNTIIGIEK